MPLSAMLREIENFRTKEKNLVIRDYENKLTLAAAQKRRANEEKEQHLAEVTNQENRYAFNTALVDSALRDIGDATTTSGIRRTLRTIKNSTKQTWELFCALNPLHIAILRKKWTVVSCLLEFGVDYKFGKSNIAPAYTLALPFRPKKDHMLAPDEEKIYKLMFQRILKDVIQDSNNDNLEWLLNAIDMSPELINSPIPEQHGLTPAMQLAKDNHMGALMVIDKNLYDDEDETVLRENTFFTTTDDFGKTAFDYAFAEGHKELSLWLLEKTKPELTPIEKACKDGDLTEVERLLAINDGSVNVTVRNNAPLLWAVMQNHKDIVASLIASNRVDISANDNVALITAIRCAYADISYLYIAKQLIAAGADITAQNDLAIKYAKAKFAKAANIEPETVVTTELNVLDFVNQAVLKSEKVITIKQNITAAHALYLWQNNQIRNHEAKEWEQLTATANTLKEEIIQQEQLAQQILMAPINEDELKNSMATITDFGTKANVLFGYNSRVGLGTLSAETQINLAETVATTKDKILFESLTNQVARNTAIKVACKLYNL
jgi:ankyrin repeat protein